MVEFLDETVPLHYMYSEVLFKCWEMHYFHHFSLTFGNFNTLLNLEGKSPVVEEAHKELFFECSF